MSYLEMILLGVGGILGCMAQVYKMQRDDLAALVVYSGILGETEE